MIPSITEQEYVDYFNAGLDLKAVLQCANKGVLHQLSVENERFIRNKEKKPSDLPQLRLFSIISQEHQQTLINKIALINSIQAKFIHFESDQKHEGDHTALAIHYFQNVMQPVVQNWNKTFYEKSYRIIYCGDNVINTKLEFCSLTTDQLKDQKAWNSYETLVKNYPKLLDAKCCLENVSPGYEICLNRKLIDSIRKRRYEETKKKVLSRKLTEAFAHRCASNFNRFGVLLEDSKDLYIRMLFVNSKECKYFERVVIVKKDVLRKS